MDDITRVKNLIASRAASANFFMTDNDAKVLAKEKLIHEGKLESSQMTWNEWSSGKRLYLKLGCTGKNSILEFCSSDQDAPTAKPWTANALEASAKPVIAASTCCGEIIGTAIAGSGTRVANAAMALVKAPPAVK